MSRIAMRQQERAAARGLTRIVIIQIFLWQVERQVVFLLTIISLTQRFKKMSVAVAKNGFF